MFQNTSEADYVAAIRRNDLETVKKLLDEREEFNLDVVGADGKFAVQIALENENVGMYVVRKPSGLPCLSIGHLF